MVVLIAGLLIFLGGHSVRIFAEGWRTGAIAKLGPMRWKGLYSLVSLVGFVLIVWGYGLARQEPVVLWPAAPAAVRHISSLLTLIAFVLLAASQLPNNQIRGRLRHPMLLGVKVWAFAHLIANNTLADLVLFGAFLAWAALDFRAARQRDRREGTVYPAGTLTGTLIALAVGIAAWAAFALGLHVMLIGVDPLAV